MSLLPEINQASAEINKFVAQANIHQTIAPVNPAAFTDPADTLLLASRDPVIREVSVGMTGVEAVQRTVSGTPPLSLPNSLGKPLKAWSVDLLPYQEGTGDPSPSNVRAIHGTNQISFVTSGKNLYSREDSVYNVPVYAQDGTSAPYPDVAVWWMPAKPNTNYTVSCNHNEQIFYVRWINCDSNKGFINRVGSSFTELSLPITTTTPANCRWVQIAINQYPAGQIAQNDWEVMVVEGSTAVDYEPYNGSQTVLTLPQTVYTGTIGSDGGESRTATITYTGADSENWSAYLDNGFSIVIDNMQEGRRQQGRANWLKVDTVGISEDNLAWLGVANKRLYAVRTSDLLPEFTVSAWKAYLALHPLQVEYPLATPAEFAVTSPTIPTPTGTATTWATAEDGTVESMEVTYYKSE